MKFLKRNCFFLCFLFAFSLMMNGVAYAQKSGGKKKGIDPFEKKVGIIERNYRELSPEGRKKLEEALGARSFKLGLKEKPKANSKKELPNLKADKGFGNLKSDELYKNLIKEKIRLYRSTLEL